MSGGLDATVEVMSLPRSAEGARRLGGELAAAMDKLGASGRSRYRCELVAEEILTNLVKYGGGDGDDMVEMRLTLEPTELRLEVFDHTPPYSPESSDPEPLGADRHRVREGGLGLSLVRRSTDSLFYDRDEDGRNQTIAVFVRDSGEDELDKARTAPPEDPPY